MVLEAHDKGAKTGQWSGITIHSTGVGNRSLAQSDEWYRSFFHNMVDWLTKKDKSYVSAHYIIGRAGELAELVNPETHIAWHAGKSSWWNPIKRVWQSGCNNFMIGIELVGDGNKGIYTVEQYEKLSLLCKQLKRRYPSIQYNCIVGHDMISPGRKNDPGFNFNWDYFFNLLFKQA